MNNESTTESNRPLPTDLRLQAARLELEKAELKPYFDQVCRKDDWKAPIDAYCRREDFPKVQRAIEFFTATTAIYLEPLPANEHWVHVVAVGYRQGPAGDH